MPAPIVDLRSDTVTRPGPGMREAISSAVVGDDVLGDDPTVHRLEAHMTALFGMEAAVFVPSGTMANLLALLAQTRPGDEIVVDRNCHIFNYEAGGAATIGGLQIYTTDGAGGRLPLDELPGAVRPDNIHHPRTSLVAIENTHNRAGGTVYPLDEVEAVSTFARERGLRLHLDGARLANAVVATGIPFETWTSLVDSVNFCFSKGLGAPVGSVLCADAATISSARRWRKRLGGGMRQAGILAAACLLAMERNVERLAEDHERAKRIGEIVEKSPLARLRNPVETNMVILESIDGSLDVAALRAELERAGILALDIGHGAMRMVTHLDIDDGGIARVEEVLPPLLGL